jgi:ATP-dependent DNA ligase
MCSSTFLDGDGRPSFNLLQNYGSSTAPVLYFVFDVLVLRGPDVMHEPLEGRRERLVTNTTSSVAVSTSGGIECVRR